MLNACDKFYDLNTTLDILKEMKSRVILFRVATGIFLNPPSPAAVKKVRITSYVLLWVTGYVLLWVTRLGHVFQLRSCVNVCSIYSLGHNFEVKCCIYQHLEALYGAFE